MKVFSLSVLVLVVLLSLFAGSRGQTGVLIPALKVHQLALLNNGRVQEIRTVETASPVTITDPRRVRTGIFG